MTIELRDVTMENYFDVLNFDVKEYQKQFIATTSFSNISPVSLNP